MDFYLLLWILLPYIININFLYYLFGVYLKQSKDIEIQIKISLKKVMMVYNIIIIVRIVDVKIHKYIISIARGVGGGPLWSVYPN